MGSGLKAIVLIDRKLDTPFVTRSSGEYPLMDLEQVWKIREEELYPSLFGPISRGIFPLTHQLFAERFKQADIDPRWLFQGVFEFAPTADRPSWIYATSGYSNPWDTEPENYNPADESGAGVEFTFSVSEQSDWAIQTLQYVLAFDILLGAGRFAGGDRLSLHDRIPLHAPINGQPNCLLRNLMLVEREDGPQEFSLPSGEVILIGFTGITDAELAFAKANGSPALIEILRKAGYHPVTDPNRQSLPV